MENNKLLPSETLIRGVSSFKEKKFTVSDSVKRIEYLIENSLKEIAACDGGWTTLYLDESDGRYWELFYPEYNEHDAGPPSLRNISEIEAREKYKF